MPASEPTFTPADAQRVLNVARSAPIANLDAADERRDLLMRFAAWANMAFAVIEQATKAALEKQPAPPHGETLQP